MFHVACECHHNIQWSMWPADVITICDGGQCRACRCKTHPVYPHPVYPHLIYPHPTLTPSATIVTPSFPHAHSQSPSPSPCSSPRVLPPCSPHVTLPILLTLKSPPSVRKSVHALPHPILSSPVVVVLSIALTQPVKSTFRASSSTSS